MDHALCVDGVDILQVPWRCDDSRYRMVSAALDIPELYRHFHQIPDLALGT